MVGSDKYYKVGIDKVVVLFSSLVSLLWVIKY